MRIARQRQIPPWEHASRSSYGKWKGAGCQKTSAYGLLNQSFRSCEQIASRIADVHSSLTSTLDYTLESDELTTVKAKLEPVLLDIGINLQQLIYTPLTRSQRKLCIELLQRVHTLADYISTDSLFKFLVSYSQVTNTRTYLEDKRETDERPTAPTASDGYGNIKKSSWKICENLFSRLYESEFPISSETAPHLVSSYMRLCVGYGQNSEDFNGMYHRAISDIVEENVKVTEGALDELLLLYDRLGVFDKRFAVYYSNRIAKNFNLYTENQVGNFCRYMTKLPFIKKKPSSMEWVRGRTYSKDYKTCKSEFSNIKTKRLPRYYRKMLLDRRDDKFTVRVDYSGSISDSVRSKVLSDWDFVTCKFIQCLEKELLYVLHEYTYFNLIDVGEMFFVYGINSNLMPRFSTELSKYLYILKYGYPIKALVVLSSLKQGDSITFRRLIRNIPSMLAFSFPMEMIAEAIISCGTIGITNQKLYNRLAEYLQRRIAYFENQNLVCRIFDALSLVNVPQYGLYNQVVTLSECIPSWLHLRHLISIARSGVKVGIVDDRIFHSIISKDTEVHECTAEELIPVVKLSHNFVKSILDENGLTKWYKFLFTILESLDVNSNLDIENLMELLEGLAMIQIKPAHIEKLSTKILRGADGVDICKLVSLFSILGRVEYEELFTTLEQLVDTNVHSFSGNQCSGLIWDMIAIGFPYNSLVLSKVVQRFNQLKPTYNEHLMLIISSMIKFNAKRNPSELMSKHWREFLKVVKDLKDVSWHRNLEDAEIIKSVAKGIEGAQVFVSEFPYTIDLSIPIDELDKLYGRYLREANGVHGSVGNATVEPVDTRTSLGDNTSIQEDSVYTQPTYEEPSEKVGALTSLGNQRIALFFYRSDQNPFVVTIRPDGSHERKFNFYHQTRWVGVKLMYTLEIYRRMLLKGLGWAHVLTFTPNSGPL